MKKKNLKLSDRGKLIIVISVLAILFGFLFFNIEKNGENHEIIKEENYYMKIDYPDIENKKENRKIIASIKKYIDEKKGEFIDSVRDLENKEIVYDFLVSNSMSEYEDITSVHLTVYSYTGGAHYIREDKSYYFKKDVGEEVDLTHFLVELDSLKRLADVSYSYILKYGAENDLNFLEDTVREGTEATFENFSHFTFMQSGLEILFPPYQVASWADGEIRIVIPYNELKGIIKDEYLKVSDIPSDVVVEKKTRDLTKFRDKKLIAFTFDDGPSNGPTNKLLDNLDRFEARVTFFVLGSRVNQYSSSLLRAYEQGNQIGSHTYSHLNLFKLKDADILREITNTNANVNAIIGEEPRLLRPPYGNINSEIKSLTNMYTILWNIDPEDWKYKDKDKIAANIVKNAHDGAIVLLHDIYETSVDGAILAMEQLQQEGYAFVTIDEMVTLKNVELDKSKSYFKF